jgi:hypothetical protein
VFLLRPPPFLVLDVELERGVCLLTLALVEPEAAPYAWRSLGLRLLLRLRGLDTCVQPSSVYSLQLFALLRLPVPRLTFCSPRFALAFPFIFVKAPGLCCPLPAFF